MAVVLRLSDHGGFTPRWKKIWPATTRVNVRRMKAEAILNRAAAKAILEQRELGLDEWTGGEYQTDNFILHMHKMPNRAGGRQAAGR